MAAGLDCVMTESEVVQISDLMGPTKLAQLASIAKFYIDKKLTGAVAVWEPETATSPAFSLVAIVGQEKISLAQALLEAGGVTRPEPASS